MPWPNISPNAGAIAIIVVANVLSQLGPNQCWLTFVGRHVMNGAAAPVKAWPTKTQ